MKYIIWERLIKKIELSMVNALVVKNTSRWVMNFGIQTRVDLCDLVRNVKNVTTRGD